MFLNFEYSGDQWRCPEKQLQDYFLQKNVIFLVVCVIHQIPFFIEFYVHVCSL